jgi:hypothetical protein
MSSGSAGGTGVAGTGADVPGGAGVTGEAEGAGGVVVAG